MFDRFLLGFRPVYSLPNIGTLALQTVDIIDNTFSHYSSAQTRLNNNLFGGAIEVDIKGITKLKFIDQPKLSGEFNSSGWKREWAKDDTPVTVEDSLLKIQDKDLQDKAFAVGVAAGSKKWLMAEVRYINTGREYRALAAQSPSVNWAIQDAYVSNTYYQRATHFASGLYYGHFGRFATRYNPVCTDIYGRSKDANTRFGLDSVPISIYSPVDLHEQLTNTELDPVLPLGAATYDRSGVTVELTGEPLENLTYSTYLAVLKNSNKKQFLTGRVGLHFERSVNKLSPLPLVADAGFQLTKVDDGGNVENFESSFILGEKIYRKTLYFSEELITNTMISGGVDVPLWKMLSCYGACQYLRSSQTFDKTYITSQSVDGGARKRATAAKDFIVGQVHFATGLRITIGNNADITAGYRLLRYTGGEDGTFTGSTVAVTEETDGSFIESGTPETLPEVQPYDQHLVEILFNFNF
jgi:hypothetical protein